MESTREQVLRLVRGHKEATVAQLAMALGLSQQAVRRHLDSLRADGLVDVRVVRHGVGRPSWVFFVTDRGEEASGRTYLQLFSRLFRHLEKSDGENGRAVLEQVFSGIAAEVAADHRAEVQGASLDERVAQVSRALEREGIVDDWRQEEGVFRLLNGECPYLRLAEMSDVPCRSDRQTIELLLGAQVEQIRRIADGEPLCEYIIRPSADGANAAPGTESQPLPAVGTAAAERLSSSRRRQTS